MLLALLAVAVWMGGVPSQGVGEKPPYARWGLLPSLEKVAMLGSRL